MPHKIGIVGAGGVGGIHAAILARDPRVKLHGFFDLDEGRAQAMASRFDGTAARSLEELLQGCDAAFVCTPNTTHEQVATAVLKAGKHVFCEKPFALNLESATRLRDQAYLGARQHVEVDIDIFGKAAPQMRRLVEAEIAPVINRRETFVRALRIMNAVIAVAA